MQLLVSLSAKKAVLLLACNRVTNIAVEMFILFAAYNLSVEHQFL